MEEYFFRIKISIRLTNIKGYKSSFKCSNTDSLIGKKGATKGEEEKNLNR